MENLRRVRSWRQYEFIRKSDGKVLVKGETAWVFVDAKIGVPRAIPDEGSPVFEKSQSTYNSFNLSKAYHKLSIAFSALRAR